MFNITNTKRSHLFILITLIISGLLLAACTGTAVPTVPVIGLRDLTENTAVESPVENAVLPVVPSAAGETTISDQPANVPAAADDNVANQAQIADRSQHIFDPETAPDLSQAEIDGLLYMREEEKLARDVYLAFYEQWGVPVFQNIAGSEQAHMDSVLFLLEQYGLDDPAADLGAGEFTNPLFQTLYADLLSQGSLSLADALTVGATIEELDIVDLQERLAQTENEYIVQIYNNLLAGSENHLRTFVGQLERQTGSSYQPQYLDDAAYQAILSGSAGRGNGSGGGNGGNGGNGQGGFGNGQGGNGQGGNGNGRGGNGSQGFGGGNGRGQANNNSA